MTMNIQDIGHRILAKGTLGRHYHDSITFLIPKGFRNDAADPIQNLWIAQDQTGKCVATRKDTITFQTVACKDLRRFLDF